MGLLVVSRFINLARNHAELQDYMILFHTSSIVKGKKNLVFVIFDILWTQP